MTQKEQRQSAEFKTKWVLVYKDTTNEVYPVEIYISRTNPYLFCRPTCGDWEVWKIDPRTEWRKDSVLCTFDYMIENY